MGQAESSSAPCEGIAMWRASNSAKGKGARDVAKDKHCSETVDSDEAGYCDCPSGHYYYDAGHAPFMCQDQCKGARPHQMDETRSVMREWQDTKRAQRGMSTTARSQTSQRTVLVIALLLGLYALLRSRGDRTSAKQSYLDRMKRDGVI